MSKTKTQKSPMIPLLIPSAPGEHDPGEPDEELPGIGRVRELSLKEARDMLRGKAEFSEAMVAGVRLVAWHHRPALYVEDRTVAPYVRYFVRFPRESGIGRCPACGRWFLQKKPTQVYDTIPHRESHRVKLWRLGKGKKKYLSDTNFTLSRYAYCVTVPIRIPEPSITQSHRRPSYRSPSVG